jgi:hypothetical protein
LLACTSTVIVDAVPPAADEDAEEAGAGGELLEPPELQAAAKTAATASGPPTRSASEAFLDENGLFICCAFRFRWNIECELECLALVNTPQR